MKQRILQLWTSMTCEVPYDEEDITEKTAQQVGERINEWMADHPEGCIAVYEGYFDGPIETPETETVTA